MKIRKINFFNMVEILLALTVIAIGMTSVLGLFPVGLNASREAIAQNCSADVADQMVTYMRVMGESSDDAYNKTFNYKGDSPTTSLPIYDNSSGSTNDNNDNNTLDIFSSLNSKGEYTTTINLDGNSSLPIDYDPGPNPSISSDDDIGLSEKFLAAYKAGEINEPGSSSHDFSRVAKGWAIFIPKTSTTDLRRRVYFVIQGPSCTETSATNRSIDYSAMALVWKEPVQIKRRKSDGSWGLWPENPLTSDSFYPALDPTLSASYAASAKINVELSWPLELPYKERKKRYYQVVINKPN